MIDPLELAARTRAALREIAESAITNDFVVSSAGRALADAERRADRLHVLWGTVTAPGVEVVKTPRGVAAGAVKKVIRRATSWYVEPRWGAQHEIDAEMARFASAAAQAVRSLERDVEVLRSQVDRLAQRLHETERRHQEIDEAHKVRHRT